MIDDLTPEAREQLEKFKALPIEEKLFANPAGQLYTEQVAGIGEISVCPGPVEMTTVGTDANGEPVALVGEPIGVIRRDTGDSRLCIRFKIKFPNHLAGRIGEMWHLGSEPEGNGFFRIVCDHIWEELADGSSICFECDEQRPAEEGDE